MIDQSELPEDVLAAIGANRKIDAIKLLREQRKLGLKEAKEIVDAYMSGNPAPVVSQGPRTDSGLGRLLLVALVAGIFYAAYRFFS